MILTKMTEKFHPNHCVSGNSEDSDEDKNLTCSFPPHFYPPQKETVSGENIPGDSREVTGSNEHLSGIKIDASGVEEIFLSGLDDCSSGESENDISGIMDRIVADVKPDLTNLDEIVMANELQTTDRENNRTKKTVLKKQRYSEEGDSQCNQSDSPESGQPVSGPFVVGNQTDITTEMPENLADSCSTSSGNHQTENSSSGLDSNPVFGQSLLEAYRWHSVGMPDCPDRSNLKKLTLTDYPVARQQKIRTDLTLADKVRLINVSETTGRSQRSLAAEFHISVGSVNNILRRKREYKEAFKSKNMASSSKASHTFHSPPVSDLQRVMFRWVDVARTKVKPITWSMVLDKTREFAAKLKVTNPNPSDAWLQTIHKAIDTSVKTIAVRSENDASVMGMWHKMLPYLMQGYQPESIFSVTETTLYYKCLPDSCYIGGRTSQNCNKHMDLLEHRFTILLCCNMLGERLKPLVVSRHACPPSMCDVAVDDLPVEWCCHPNAAITANIFAGWLRNLDISMAQQKRHIALFLEMTPVHLSAMLLKHVSLKYFLDNSSHLLQPFNHGILRHFKAWFRRRLLQMVLVHCNGADESEVSDGGMQPVSGVTELDTIFWIQDAWRSVSLDTIRTSFHKAAFPHVSNSSTSCPLPARSEPLPGDFIHLVQEVGRAFRFTSMDAILYAEFDSQVPCHCSDTEDWEKALWEDSSASVRISLKKEPGVIDDEGGSGCLVQLSGLEEGEDSSGTDVEPAEALECLHTLKRFSANNIGLLTTVFELESVLLDSIGFPMYI